MHQLPTDTNQQGYPRAEANKGFSHELICFDVPCSFPNPVIGLVMPIRFPGKALDNVWLPANTQIVQDVSCNAYPPLY